MLALGIIRQIIVIIILSIVGVTALTRFIISDRQYLKFKDDLNLDYILNVSDKLSEEIGKYVNWYDDIIDGKISQDEFQKHSFKNSRVKYNCISFAFVDRKTKKIYVNTSDYCFEKDELENDLNRTKNIEAYIRKYALVYYKADHIDTFSPFGEIYIRKDHEKIKPYSKKLQRFTEYYWLDKRNTDNQDSIYKLYSNMYRAWIELVYIILWFFILIFFIMHLRKKGFEEISLSAKREIQSLKLALDDSILVIKRIRKISIKVLNIVLEKLIIQNLTLRYILMLILAIAFFTISLSGFSLNFFENYSVDAFIIYLILLSFYVMKKVIYFNYILRSTHKISKGDFSVKLKEKGDKDLIKLAHNINSIKDNYEKVLQERIKDEKLKSEIVLNVSNNLKLPVNSIKNYIKLYQNENALEVEKNEYIDIIYNKAKKLKSLIENLFEVSKLNSGKVELHKEKIDIVALIYQVIGETSFDYTEKNIKFIVESFKEEIIINVDAKKISKLMENLISNALKYSVANTRVYIDVRQEQDKIKISIKNVANYELNADENKKVKLKNPGFGLVIANGIAELHGGSVNIEGEGDLFKVYLKIKYC